MRYILLLIAVIDSFIQIHAQEAFVEVSGTTSSGNHAPLWLSSNKQGIVSPYANSAYERIGYKHDLFFGKKIENDSSDIHQERDWHLTASADLMLSQNAQQTFCIHQLYGELAYKRVTVTIGQKEREIDLRNNRLTSGGLSQGINAQPIPEALVSVAYFSIPFTNHWWKWRFRIGYGKTTDGSWQKNWVDASISKYTSNILYHEKTLGWKVGDEKRFPLTFEPSIMMMTQFGGTSYNAYGRNHYDGEPISHPENLNAFWRAFWPIGSEDATDGNISNAAGNTLGSYNFALTWHGKDWMLRGYYERFFEDQSMLTVQYGLFDHLAGIEVELPSNPYVSHILVEHMSSKDQAGPVYHDSTPNMPESYTGIDNYYNHGSYGWQNYGMTIGNPLITSPIYNNNHDLYFYNNRILAWHIGIDGNPVEWLSWRLLATWTRNWGTYREPLDDVRNEEYFLVEAAVHPRKLTGWQATLAIGYDHGNLEMLGNSFGAQLTIRKEIKF